MQHVQVDGQTETASGQMMSALTVSFLCNDLLITITINEQMRTNANAFMLNRSTEDERRICENEKMCNTFLLFQPAVGDNSVKDNSRTGDDDGENLKDDSQFTGQK